MIVSTENRDQFRNENSFCFGEAFQIIAGELHHSPVFSETSSQSLINVYGGRVPIEHFPSDSVTFLLEGDPCKVNHESFADALAPELRPNKEVFQEETVLSLPR